MSEQLLQWSGRALTVAPAERQDRLLVADSLLVSDGLARGLEWHRKRFFQSCLASANIPLTILTQFWQHAMAAVPPLGQWFPRIELVQGNAVQLQIRIRPAPPLTSSIRMLRWPGPDLRTQPRCKGPDLHLLTSMRMQAVASGADEALLTTPGGIVLEGLTTSLVWWEGDTLCAPSPSLRVLPSITSHLLLELAKTEHVPVEYRRKHVEELDGLTVWTVNALHGIRPLIQWVDSNWTAATQKDHRPFHDKMIRLSKPLANINGTYPDLALC